MIEELEPAFPEKSVHNAREQYSPEWPAPPELDEPTYDREHP
jgi:hypothetical protein